MQRKEELERIKIELEKEKIVTKERSEDVKEWENFTDNLLDKLEAKIDAIQKVLNQVKSKYPEQEETDSKCKNQFFSK